MGELFEECAVLPGDTRDEEGLRRFKAAIAAKPWRGVYALPVEGTETADSSPIYRCVRDAANPTSTILLNEGVELFPEIKSPYLLLKTAARLYGPDLCVGERQPIRDAEGKQIGLTNFKYFTYADTLRIVEALGRALDTEVGIPVSEYEPIDGVYPKPLRVLGIWSRSRMDWRLVDFAANYRGIVTVPLYDTLGAESVNFIIKRTKMEVLAAEGSKLSAALSLKEAGISIRAVISFDPPTKEQVEAYEKAGVQLYHQQDLRRKYLSVPDLKTPDELVPSFDDIATIIFTSGTTGPPKGAVHTNGSILTFVGSYIRSNNRLRVSPGESTLTYLPMAHIYQRGVDLIVCLLGVRVGFYSGNMLQIVEDMQLFKPTVFIGVPRVFSKILTNIQSGIKAKSSLVQWLAAKALESKKHKYANNPTALSALLPDLLFRKVRATFGGNIRTLSMGSAPMDSEQLKELQLYLSASISEGWGMTEAGIAFVQDFEDGAKGTIGGALPATEFRVVSLPALQYDAKGTPPRGELLVRGKGVMKEYFLDKEKTEEAFDAEGWFKTGDVVQIEPSGAVRIIDRAKNIFKLAHGEYVAPERLENIYSNSPWVEQIFVHGNSLEAALVAVVVVSMAEVKKWAADNGKAGVAPEELLEDASLKAKILHDLEVLGRRQLKGFEIIKRLHLVSTPFSVETGLATPTAKLIRPAARDKFQKEIKDMYASLAAETQQAANH